MFVSQEALWLAELGKCCIDPTRGLFAAALFVCVVLFVRMELKQVKGQRAADRGGQKVSWCGSRGCRELEGQMGVDEGSSQVWTKLP